MPRANANKDVSNNDNNKEKAVNINNDKQFSGLLAQLGNIINQSNLSLYGTDRQSEVAELDAKFQQLMQHEIQTVTGRGEGDGSSLLTKLFNSDKMGNAYQRSIEDQFMNITADDASVMANYVREMYKNRFTEQSDLHEVASSLIELSEAIDITRDAIITSDVVEGRVSRTISFGSYSDTEDKLIEIVERMEEKHDILLKIKNFIVPNTLELGTYYAYVVPYSELFNQFAKAKEKTTPTQNSIYHRETASDYSYGDMNVFESTMINDTQNINKSTYNTNTAKKPKHSSVAERAYSVYTESTKTSDKTATKEINKEEFVSDIDNMLERVIISNDAIPLPLLESGEGAFRLFKDDYDNITPITEAYTPKKRKTKKNTFDMVSSINHGSEGIASDSSTSKNNEFSDIGDCYNKLYSSMEMIPVEIMHKKIGYYKILIDPTVTTLNGPVSNNLFYREIDSTRRCERTIVDQMAEAIVNSFNKDFLKDNLEFKELIVDAITHYNLNENRIKFQFVPCEYVQEFKIDEDVNGNGQSMIKKSLFYAKLYLMLLLFKVMTIIQNSNDIKVNYIRSSGLDKNLANKVQEIARMKQSRQINMADLFNYTTLINKVGMGNEMYIPTGRSNERPMETEILSGQDVNLDTPLLENLKNSYILATGVPAAILNYLHEADFSKTQELNNTKFNGRVVNYQLDFNKSITEYYKKIMRFSTNIEPEYIESFKFTLQQPKNSNANVKSEAIQTFTAIMNFISELYYGEQAQDDITLRKINIFKRKFAKDQLPMFNWDRIEEIINETDIDVQKELLKPDPQNGDNADDDGLDGFDDM